MYMYLVKNQNPSIKENYTCTCRKLELEIFILIHVHVIILIHAMYVHFFYSLFLDEGVLFQVKWGEHKIAVFTSARNINYIGLYQIYEVLFKHLVTRMNFKMRMRKLGVKSIRAPSFIRQGLIRLGALPSSSPVCGLLRISEMERLVSSYDVKIPQVFYDLFINNALSVEPVEPDVFRDFTNTEEKFVVSYPRDRIDTSASDLESLPHSSTPPTSSNNRLTYKNTSTLQSLAKKISMKNHRLAAASSSTTSPTSIFAPVSHGKRTCYSCGRSYASSKKRCEDCGIFLVGYPCPVCGSINYTLCSKCTQCGAALDRTKLSSSTPTPNLSPVVQKQTSKTSISITYMYNTCTTIHVHVQKYCILYTSIPYIIFI